MEIRIDGLSKRYSRRWVFRHLSFHITAGTQVAISGPNGSGKSTLLRIVAGALPASEGTVHYVKQGSAVPESEVFHHITFAAPYVDLIEEMSLSEAWHFHRRFRKFYPEADHFQAFLNGMEHAFDPKTHIQSLSSGMKQRVRLALALFSISDVILLDEPTSNLDVSGVQWFHRTLEAFQKDRTVVIASNLREDLAACTEEIALG